MSLRATRLPTRFPVGTRYIVEGQSSDQGRLRIQSRYLEFPDGRHLDLPLQYSDRALSRRAWRRNTRK